MADVIQFGIALPQFGERLASFWLPLACHAEDQAHQVGDGTKFFYPNAYRYREWVIDAFNRDLPYDQFLKLQLAADALISDLKVPMMHLRIQKSALAKASQRANRLQTAGVSRRDFVKSAIAAGLAAGASSLAAESKEMIYRTLGQTGEKVSAIGLGGYHIGVPKEEQEGIKIIRTAIDRGITFLDNSWDYHDGGSEIRMGKALRDGYREKVFLMTKIDGRSKKAAAKQIDECLKRLQTDRIDLMQHHEVIRMEDPDRIFAEDGANEAMLEAKRAGKIRFIGFTGHKDPTVHLRMLEVASAHKFRFDTVQMPLNVMDAHFRSFQQKVLPTLVKEKIGVLGMKPLGSGAILETGAVTAIECLQYALNLSTSVVITGMDSMKILEQALEAVHTFQPMNRQQVAALLSRTAQFAESGQYERFKTSANFDATAHHPEWLG